MKKQLTYLLLLISGWLYTSAQSAIDYIQMERMLANGQCNQLVQKADEIRSLPYGKNPLTDYYLAQAYCCKGMYSVASVGFDYIESQHKVDQRLITVVSSARSACRANTELFSVEEDDFIDRLVVALLNEEGGSSRLGGKMGRILNCEDPAPAFEMDPDFNALEIRKRRFAIDQSDRAVQYYDSLLDGMLMNVRAQGRFILITAKDSDLSESSFRDAADKLEEVYKFYYTYYGVRPPDKLIAVYLMGNTHHLRRVAKKVHGITLPASNLGYSNLTDLSVLGNSTKQGLGTIKHELFHLMIRTDIGDIPGWLDEGIAAMYEESWWNNGKLVPISRTWRTNALRSMIRKDVLIPSLELLINNNWSEFNPNPFTSSVTACEVAANYAIAKHFAMYLDDIGKLQPMVEAFKDRKNVFVNPEYRNEQPIHIVERVMEMPMPVIQVAFNKWMKKEFHIRMRFDDFR